MSWADWPLSSACWVWQERWTSFWPEKDAAPATGQQAPWQHIQAEALSRSLLVKGEERIASRGGVWGARGTFQEQTDAGSVGTTLPPAFLPVFLFESDNFHHGSCEAMAGLVVSHRPRF